MIRIRPYKVTDADVIVSWCQEEKAFYQWTAGVLGNYPITPKEFGFVESLMPFTAFDDTGIVGFFTLRNPGDSLDELRFGFVIVNPDKRGNGYGKAMLQLGLQFVFGLYGAKKASLGVFENNTAAYRCYQAVGFREVILDVAETYHVLGEVWKCREMVIENRDKTLYVTDLDGTLLNKNDRISPQSIRIINDLVEQGMLFTYATARSLVSALTVTEGLSTKIPVIVYNGAFIIQPSTEEILSREGFSREETDWVRTVLNRCQISPLVYAFVDGVEKVTWMRNKENDGIKRYLSMRKGDRRLNPITDQDLLYQGDMFYFTCIGEEEELKPIHDIFSKDSRYRCTIQQELYRPEYWCEIMPARATKAYAIQKLQEMWGCKRVVSFGDAINDLPMFGISDEAYAVENAVEALKAAATGIIGSNEKDGVALWLQERLRNRETGD